jgi:hypothetical protein
MPTVKVNGKTKKFAYTKKGKKQAAKARASAKIKRTGRYA